MNTLQHKTKNSPPQRKKKLLPDLSSPQIVGIGEVLLCSPTLCCLWFEWLKCSAGACSSEEKNPRCYQGPQGFGNIPADQPHRVSNMKSPQISECIPNLKLFENVIISWDDFVSYSWAQEFLNEQNKGLDVLVEYLSQAQCDAPWVAQRQ